jgi:citrate synthase
MRDRTESNKPKPATAIAFADRDRVTVRGLDLCRDLIGKVSFTEYFLILVTGARPTPALVALTDATMVAIAEHGVVSSVQVARMTLATAPEALQGAVAAGLLGCGNVILGASENAGAVLAEIAAAVATQGKSLHQAVFEKLSQIRDAKKHLPGFGHPVHRDGDPRATRLLELADQLGVTGSHCAVLRGIESQTEAVFGRKLPVNVSAAIPAVLLDAGFPVHALRGIPIVARAAGLIAHLTEEKQHPIGRILSAVAGKAIAYEPDL